MIRYEKLSNSDVKAFTDDKQAELAELEEALSEAEWDDAETAKNLANAKKGEDGIAEFVIPANEVTDMSDVFWDIDNGKLAGLIEQWNDEAIEAASEDD